LAGVAGESRRELVIEFLRAEVARALGIVDPWSVDFEQGLFEMGMDSLMSVELSNRLRESLDCQLATTLAFEHPTAAALTDYLAKQVLALADTPREAGAPDESELARVRLLKDVERLGDDEAERSLAEELDRAGY
jgi:acyl carrier protein